MIDEEKQPDNTSQPPEESETVSQQNREAEELAAPEVELLDNTDLESQMDQSAEAQALTDLGEAQDFTVADRFDASLSDDLAALETLQQENEALKAQLDELNQQVEAFKTQSVRIAADFDNFRKRTAKEKEELEQQVKRVTLSELLAVVDNFERARSQIKPQTEGEMTIHKSYQGIYKQLVDSLKRLGVSPMRPEGKDFDPNLHEAVMREPTDEYPEGVVTEQLVRGYVLGERVLRHAMVKVAAAPESSTEDSSAQSDSVV